MSQENYIVEEVAGLYKVVSLAKLRHTPGVYFDSVPRKILPEIHAVDRVLHDQGAISPGPVEGVERPWYMHPSQNDNLMVLAGIRYVDIYSVAHGRIESFEVGPNLVKHNDRVVYHGPVMLVWPRYVFHRIESGAEGSASINFAVHYEGIDLTTNFNIYDLNIQSGEYKVIREGFRDQF